MNIAGKEKTGAVMVVGAGIAGLQASLDLAESGFYVYLVERQTAIGGVMPQLDKTFPTNDCSICIISPKLADVARHLNIEILAPARVKGIAGASGRFTVTVEQSARYIDTAKCIACGLCAEKCPKKVPDSFNAGLARRKAAYVLYPQAVPLKYAIDKANCIYFQKGTCRACEKFCPVQAVDFSQPDQERDLEVGAIILAPGFQTFDARLKPEYGYGRYPNVVTGPGVRTPPFRHRPHLGPCGTAFRSATSQEDRLDSVRRLPGRQHRPGILLIRLLHVRHQTGYHFGGARRSY